MKEIYKIKANTPLAEALKDNVPAQQQLYDEVIKIYSDITQINDKTVRRYRMSESLTFLNIIIFIVLLTVSNLTP